MDYKRVYDNIIHKAKSENRKKTKEVYYEKHHIIPRCIGWNDEKDNAVLLTAKEHFICHMLLCEINDEPKLKYAFWAMCNQVFGDVKRDYQISSSTYERAKKQFAENFSTFMKNLPEEKRGFKKGSKHSLNLIGSLSLWYSALISQILIENSSGSLIEALIYGQANGYT